jgi:hypothetical protein
MANLVPRLARSVANDLIITTTPQEFTRQATRSARTIKFIEVDNYGSSHHPLSSSSLLQAVARSHSARSNQQAVTNTTTPAYPNRTDTPSTLFHASSSDTIMPKDAALAVGSAANGSSLWHSILDTYGKEILQCASDQFLDLAMALRLESINTRDLNGLLAKAGRLGCRDTNIVEGNVVGFLAHEAGEGPQPSLRTHSASKVPDVERDQGSDSTASRGPKRRKKNEERSPSFKGLRWTGAYRSGYTILLHMMRASSKRLTLGADLSS